MYNHGFCLESFSRSIQYTGPRLVTSLSNEQKVTRDVVWILLSNLEFYVVIDWL